MLYAIFAVTLAAQTRLPEPRRKSLARPDLILNWHLSVDVSHSVHWISNLIAWPLKQPGNVVAENGGPSSRRLHRAR